MLDMLQYKDLGQPVCRQSGVPGLRPAPGLQTGGHQPGNPAGRVMLVGEGPGSQEDEQGKPFVGLRASFDKIRWRRAASEDVITMWSSAGRRAIVCPKPTRPGAVCPGWSGR